MSRERCLLGYGGLNVQQPSSLSHATADRDPGLHDSYPDIWQNTITTNVTKLHLYSMLNWHNKQAGW